MNRKYIRKKIFDLLKNASLPGIGEDVFSMRSVPTSVESLPVALIYPKDELIDRFDESPKRYARALSITIEVISTHDTDDCLTDELDDLAEAIESVIENDTTLELEVESIDLKAVIFDQESDGQSPIGSAKITYDITYISEPRSEGSLPYHDTTHVGWHANEHEDEDTKDIINHS